MGPVGPCPTGEGTASPRCNSPGAEACQPFRAWVRGSEVGPTSHAHRSACAGRGSPAEPLPHGARDHHRRQRPLHAGRPEVPAGEPGAAVRDPGHRAARHAGRGRISARAATVCGHDLDRCDGPELHLHHDGGVGRAERRDQHHAGVDQPDQYGDGDAAAVGRAPAARRAVRRRAVASPATSMAWTGRPMACASCWWPSSIGFAATLYAAHTLEQYRLERDACRGDPRGDARASAPGRARPRGAPQHARRDGGRPRARAQPAARRDRELRDRLPGAHRSRHGRRRCGSRIVSEISDEALRAGEVLRRIREFARSGEIRRERSIRTSSSGDGGPPRPTASRAARRRASRSSSAATSPTWRSIACRSSR